ncbi:hypothetical protein NOK73_07800, partial [Vibrio parahaemolyticus]|nr:hypothetical protein [Vibrio parahaemolyticus]
LSLVFKVQWFRFGGWRCSPLNAALCLFGGNMENEFDWVSLLGLPQLAIFISILSLSLSLFVAFRDATRFSVVTRYLESFENMSDAVYLKIVNTGRRPITLDRIDFKFSDSPTQSIKLNTHTMRRADPFDNSIAQPITLSESQFFEFTLDSRTHDFSNYDFSKLVEVKTLISRGKGVSLRTLTKSLRSKGNNLNV